MKKVVLITCLLLVVSCDFIYKFHQHFALELAEEKVKTYLKDPDSADFSSGDDTKVTESVYRELKGYIINGYVDSKNDSGTISRRNYSIEIYHNPDLDTYKFTNFILTD